MSLAGTIRGIRRRRHRTIGVTALIILTTAWTPADGQLRPSQRRVASAGDTQNNVQLLRPSGGPVVPMFEGWYRNPDGTFVLSFGYFNVNTEETLEIPLGPDNFIEPAVFDGVQPTHFQPTPDDVYRRVGVFTVTVPADFGDSDVIWTLRIRGQTLSVPGRITRAPYELAGWKLADGTDAAPLLRLDARGPEGRGPAGLSRGPVTAAVGEPLALTVWTIRDEEFRNDERPITLDWIKHQGPGSVAFSEPRLEATREMWAAGDWAERTTEATFSEPGEYVLRVAAYSGDGQGSSQCCWTNGYVRVQVR